MKTIKIIDLLNMISKGEEVPKKIKYNIFELKRTMSNNLLRLYVDEEGMLFPEYYSCLTLNDTVEILEESKKIPEKIYHCFMETDNEEMKFLIKNFNVLVDRYNDLLDYLETKGE